MRRRPYIWYVRFYFKCLLNNSMCDKLYWTQNCGWMVNWPFFLMFCVDKIYQYGCHRMASLKSDLCGYLFSQEPLSGCIKCSSIICLYCTLIMDGHYYITIVQHGRTSKIFYSHILGNWLNPDLYIIDHYIANIF